MGTFIPYNLPYPSSSNMSHEWIPLQNGVQRTRDETIDYLQKGIEHLLLSWHALAMAGEYGWGGRDSVAKKNQLIYTVQELFHPDMESRGIVPKDMYLLKKNPEALAEWLEKKMDEHFNCDLDDESNKDVVKALFELFTSCGKNNMDVLNQIMLLPIPTLLKRPDTSSESDYEDGDGIDEDTNILNEEDH